MTTNPNPDLRTYPDEALLAAVARHANKRGLTMDLAYRTTCGAPAELLIGRAQFKMLVAELERRDVGGASDLFTNKRSFAVTFEQAKERFRDACAYCGRPGQSGNCYEGRLPGKVRDLFCGRCPVCGYPHGGTQQQEEQHA